MVAVDPTRLMFFVLFSFAHFGVSVPAQEPTIPKQNPNTTPQNPTPAPKANPAKPSETSPSTSGSLPAPPKPMPDPTWIKPENVYSSSGDDGPETYKFGPRMELNMEAAIEFWIKIPSKVDDNPIDLSKPTCVLSVAKSVDGKSGSTPHWGVYYNKDGFYLSSDGKTTSIPLQPSQFQSALKEAGSLIPQGSGTRPLPEYAFKPTPFNMPLDQWQHVVINARYRNDQLYPKDFSPLPDGNPVSPSLRSVQAVYNGDGTGKYKGFDLTQDAITSTSLLFPAPTGTGTMIMTIGSGPGASNLEGQLGVVRIWDRQLSATEIAGLKAFPSFSIPVNNPNQPPLSCRLDRNSTQAPSGICTAIPSLICSLAMNKDGIDDASSFVAPDVQALPFPAGQNLSACSPLFSRRPLGMEPRSLWLRLTENENNIQSLQVEYDQPGYWTWDILPEGAWYGDWLKTTISQIGAKPFGIEGVLEVSDFCVSGTGERIPVITPNLQRELETTLYGDALCIKKYYAKNGLARITDSLNIANSVFRVLEDGKRNVAIASDPSFMQNFIGPPTGLVIQMRTGPAALYKCAAVYGSGSINPPQSDAIQAVVINSKVLATQNWTGRQWIPSPVVGQNVCLDRYSLPWKNSMPSVNPNGAYLVVTETAPTNEIVGIAGAHDGDVVTSLRFIFSDGSVTPLRIGNGNDSANQTFVQRLPTAYPPDYPVTELQGKTAVCRFEGLLTCCDSRGMHAVTMVYSYKDRLSYQKDPGLEAQNLDITALTKGRYIGKGYDWKQPQLAPVSTLPAGVAPDPNDPTNIPIHGNYTDAPVYRFMYDDASAELTLFRDTFSGSSGIGVRRWDFRPESLTKPGSPNWVSDFGDRLTPFVVSVKDISTGLMRKELAARVTLDGSKTYIELTKPDRQLSILPGSPDYTNDYYQKIPGWDTDLFSPQQRPNFVQGNWSSYNIAAMTPQDYQNNGGTSINVFQPLQMGDKAHYAPSDGSVFVPNTLIYVPINRKEVLDSTYMSDNSNEDQKNWSFDLGVNAGCKLVGSFSLDEGYNSEVKTTYENKSNVIRSRAVTSLYALVADRSLIDFRSDESGLRNKIMEIEAALFCGTPIDWNGFFENYGTHYPYAVTYGGTVTSLDIMSEVQYSNFTKTGFDIKVSAKANLSKAFKVGGKAGYNESHATAFSQNTEHQNSSEESIGGDREKEVPICLDLRPIYDLLSPIYFDDPFVWQLVRPEMMRQLDLYLGACAAKANWNPPISSGWTPDSVELAKQAAAKAAADQAAASEILINSQIVLRNKSTGRYVSKKTSYYRDFGTTGYSTMTSSGDVASAAIFQLRNSDVNNPDDSSNLTFNEAGVAIGYPKNAYLDDPNNVLEPWQKTEAQGGYLTSMTHSIGYTSDVSNTNAKWKFIKASDGNSNDKIHIDDEIRIVNVGTNQFLYDYDGEYLWTSSTDDDSNIWIISKP